MSALSDALARELTQRLFTGVPNVEPLRDAVQPGVSAAFSAAFTVCCRSAKHTVTAKPALNCLRFPSCRSI
jgi:hypothetical protein